MINFYETKSGVDALDKNLCHYTTYCKTNRWSIAVFYNILDISAYNAFVLRKLRPPRQVAQTSYRDRFNFLMALGEALIKTNMCNRAEHPNGSNAKTSRAAIEAFSVAVAQQAGARKHQDSEGRTLAKERVATFAQEMQTAK